MIVSWIKCYSTEMLLNNEHVKPVINMIIVTSTIGGKTLFETGSCEAQAGDFNHRHEKLRKL